ncbi:SMP-30/gluconolactonase/LRE family protein [Amycolatopsis minnesotensis]|uniref:SMP-30/gluconolactonase/LRE family protein n=1 Tax=Amycolatopsis minnesotensis TaxID=337894 RepID=A0ABN2RV35_9PSEU
MLEVKDFLTGRGVTESPRWHDGRLWFADWGTHQVLAASPDGTVEVIADGPETPFCLDHTPDGKLLVITGPALVRHDPEPVVHGDLSGYSAPNDIAVDGRGNAYVGDVAFEFPMGEFVPGSIALVTPDGTVRRVADGMAFPNGMVVTPDGTTVIVAESFANRLTAFDIEADGSLSNRRVWADLGDGVPDGICLDADGAVWYADVPNKRCVRVREGGEVLERIELTQGCFACALGGDTLYLLTGDMPRGPFGDEPRTGRILTATAPSPGV